MQQEIQVEETSASAFEPSHLVEYGAACELTQGGGGPPVQPDGAVYNS